jgi:hypothetical protein
MEKYQIYPIITMDESIFPNNGGRKVEMVKQYVTGGPFTLLRGRIIGQFAPRRLNAE